MDQITQIIRDRAEAAGVDPATLLRIGQIESGLDPSAAASGSSAKGLFQFTRGTWDRYGNGANPLDPVANADAGARLLRDNAAALRNGGIEPSPGSLYLSHFAGVEGARKLLSADPSAPVASVLGDAAVKANPFLRNLSVAGVRSWADRKMGEATTPASSAASLAPTAAAAPVASAASPGAPAGAASPDAPAIDPSVLAALQAIPQQLAQNGMITPVPPQQQINMPVPPGLARARALALAMMQQPIS
jgi:hypothetical protein